jgi:hypothetical protein
MVRDPTVPTVSDRIPTEEQVRSLLLLGRYCHSAARQWFEGRLNGDPDSSEFGRASQAVGIATTKYKHELMQIGATSPLGWPDAVTTALKQIYDDIIKYERCFNCRLSARFDNELTQQSLGSLRAALDELEHGLGSRAAENEPTDLIVCSQAMLTRALGLEVPYPHIAKRLENEGVLSKLERRGPQRIAVAFTDAIKHECVKKEVARLMAQQKAKRRTKT